MTDTTPSPAPRWLAWMPAASVGALIAGGLLTGGGYISQLQEQGRRTATLERLVEQQATDMREADKRLARVEARQDVQDGEIRRPLSRPGAHVEGYNQRTIGICYVGGLATDGRTPKDTRTPAQKAALVHLLTELKHRFPAATIKGHRDYSPDRNGNGRIEPQEYMKACPSFDAAAEYAGVA